jgi:hypothetical protein
MAQDAVDRALGTGKLGVQARPCATTHLKLVLPLRYLDVTPPPLPDIPARTSFQSTQLDSV